MHLPPVQIEGDQAAGLEHGGDEGRLHTATAAKIQDGETRRQGTQASEVRHLTTLEPGINRVVDEQPLQQPHLSHGLPLPLVALFVDALSAGQTNNAASGETHDQPRLRLPAGPHP